MTTSDHVIDAELFKAESLKSRKWYYVSDVESIGLHTEMDRKSIDEVKAAAHIFPFKTNNYILDQLIDWKSIPDDPYFRLMFPQKDMLHEDDFALIDNAIKSNTGSVRIAHLINSIRSKYLPPEMKADQTSTPPVAEQTAEGIFHLPPGTLLLFPKPAEACFAYCTYCFRWSAKIDRRIHFSYEEPTAPIGYLMKNPSINNIVFTGGDPLTMQAEMLKVFVEPLLHVENVHSICFTTKALGWWPYRFLTDEDSEVLLNLLQTVQSCGKHASILAHLSHPRELTTKPFLSAVRRIQDTGTIIRCQNPLLRNINDNTDVLAELWQRELDLGLIPIYLIADSNSIMLRNFKVPFSKAIDIYKTAQQKLSYLAQTVEGVAIMYDSMKLLLMDAQEIGNKKYFIFKYLENPDIKKVGSVVFAEFNPTVTDINQLTLLGSIHERMPG